MLWGIFKTKEVVFAGFVDVRRSNWPLSFTNVLGFVQTEFDFSMDWVLESVPAKALITLRLSQVMLF
jgi:hypothetical protein